MEDEEKLLEALKSNWQHARHVETLRSQFAGGYVAIASAILLYVFRYVGEFSSVIGAFTGFFLTLVCWGMTHKWNLSFVNQIKKADICAHSLKFKSPINGNEDMHAVMGFPIRDRILKKLSVRLMFNLLYFSFTIVWLVIIRYVIIRVSN
jgi:hypothetical protein